MKKRISTKILVVVMTASILLSGCGEQLAESREESIQNSETVQEVDENVEQSSLFPGTIFDNLVMGKTSTTDVEEMLGDRILEYEYESIPNATHCLSGKTTITDGFYEWDALYKYILIGSGAREEYILTDWTVELLLNEDAEYKEAVKCIQNTIDENILADYTPIEDSYSDDIVQGNVVYYPIEKFKLNDVDGIKYIMFGKYANCDSEEAKHIIVLSVGITEEEAYQKGEIIKIPTVTVKITDNEPLRIDKQVEMPVEMENYQNIAFYIMDNYENGLCRSTSIISLNLEAGEVKTVGISPRLFLNIGDDKYGRYFYEWKEVVRAIKTLNDNLDMNIEDFIAIDCKGLSEFVDALGGVWVDVPTEMRTDEDVRMQITLHSQLGMDEPIILSNGQQLLNGNQLVFYIYYCAFKNYSLGSDQIVSDILEQMQSVDKETLEQAINVYKSKVYTSLTGEEIEEVMRNLSVYSVAGETEFPQKDMREILLLKVDSITSEFVVPTDLEASVICLHQFLFGQEDYEVSSTVKKYSSEMKEKVAQSKTE